MHIICNRNYLLTWSSIDQRCVNLSMKLVSVCMTNSQSVNKTNLDIGIVHYCLCFIITQPQRVLNYTECRNS